VRTGGHDREQAGYLPAPLARKRSPRRLAREESRTERAAAWRSFRRLFSYVGYGVRCGGASGEQLLHRVGGPAATTPGCKPGSQDTQVRVLPGPRRWTTQTRGVCNTIRARDATVAFQTFNLGVAGSNPAGRTEMRHYETTYGAVPTLTRYRVSGPGWVGAVEAHGWVIAEGDKRFAFLVGKPRRALIEYAQRKHWNVETTEVQMTC
jgi:hypothetical protein